MKTMRLPSLSTSRFIFLAFATTPVPLVLAQDCVFCDSGLFQPSEDFDGFSCADYESKIVPNLPSNSEDCTFARVGSVAICGCEAPDVTEKCHVCGTGNDLPAESLDLALPDVFNMTCGDLVDFPAVDGVDDSCNLITTKYSAFCGCPDPVPPSCGFCNDISVPADKPFPFPDDIGAGDLGCLSIHSVLSVQTDDSCDRWRTAFESQAEIDLKNYCECPGAVPPRHCGDFCPLGKQIPEDLKDVEVQDFGVDCFQVELYFTATILPSECADIGDAAILCCLEDTPPPTLAPTKAPAVQESTSAAAHILPLFGPVQLFLIALAMDALLG